MAQFKFIHAADLHIESPYKGIRSIHEELGKSLVENGIKAYENLIQTALDEKVDFLIIAGDSFDSESGSLSAQYRFVKGLQQLEEAHIPVYIICGNHDPLNSWGKHLNLPKNVVLFKAGKVQKQLFEKEGKPVAALYGVSFGEKEEYTNWASHYQRDDTTNFAIGILHGTLAGNKAHVPYSPFEMNNLRASNMNYWALGHIHKREILSETSPMVVYPGNIQGRHFNETGKKGCSLVTVDRGKIVRHDFVSLSKVIYEYEEISLNDISDFNQFSAKIEAMKQEKLKSGYSYLLRIRLTGRTAIYKALKRTQEIQDWIENLNDENNYRQAFVFIDRFINETQPNIDLEERKKSQDFIGELLRHFDSIKADENQMNEVIQKALQTLDGSTEKRMIDNTEIRNTIENNKSTILTEAMWKCVDGLIED